MSGQDASPVRWLRRFGRRRAPVQEALAEHPTPEALTAYDADELTPEQDDRIQEHFLECRDCPELLLDYKTFTAPDAADQEVPGLSDSWVAASWESLRARLAAETHAGRWRSFVARLVGRFPSAPMAYALATGFFACSVGLSFWVTSLQREVGWLQEPQLNLPIAYLHLAEATRGDQPASSFVVPPGVRSFLLVLTPLVEPMETGYRLEIRTRDGGEVWSGSGLARTDEGTFVIGLSRQFLKAGEYRILLFHDGGGGAKVVEEYAMRLLYQ